MAGFAGGKVVGVPNSKELRQLSTALASQENLRGYFVYR
jgi:hypothetical protein